MEYASIEQLRRADGLRLVLSEGLPGPWGEAIKSVLAYKQLEPMVGGQQVGGDNAELIAWTGQASAPVLVWNDDPPRIGCIEQLLLLEDIAATPALFPSTLDERAQVVGMLVEIAGAYGLGWQRRLQIAHMAITSGMAPPFMESMARRYGYSEDAAKAAGEQISWRFSWFEERLLAQVAKGSTYLVGAVVTAADFYLANFVGMFSPLPHELNPMPEPMRQSYNAPGAEVPRALLDHRDFMYAQHIKTPLTF